MSVSTLDVALNDSSTEQLTVARVGDLYIGFPLDTVQEVLMEAAITPVPLAESGFVGLINVRGDILSVVDLATRLGMARDEPQRQNFVLTRSARGLMAVTVDRVTDVIHAPSTAREEVQGNASEAFTHAYALPNRLVLVLDVERLIG